MRSILLLVAVLGCNGTPTGGNCKLGNVCEDYPGGDLVTHEKDCKTLSGEWSKGSCPSSNLIGTCTTADQQTRLYYSGGTNAYTAVTASAACEHEFHGTWKLK